MGNSVLLPFEMPLFATTQSSAAASFAMIGHSTAHYQTLNQATNICCSRKFIKGFTTPLVYIPNIQIFSYTFMERYGVSLRHTKKYCIDIIKQMIDEGFYVYYVKVDDFYIPGKSWYGTRHMHHNGIICGYDDEDGTISIAAYNINWVFSLIRIPQKAFIEALESSLEAGEYGTITAYKIKDNTVAEINEGEMLKFLREYMDSSFEKYPIDEEGEVRGCVVHDYLAMYIDKLKDGSIPYEKMDWLALRPVWEHKKCMLDRIKAVEDKNGWGDDLSTRYLPVVEKANRIRIMYAMYHKNHNDTLLDKLHDGLLDISKNDKELVSEFITKLEKCEK